MRNFSLFVLLACFFVATFSAPSFCGNTGTTTILEDETLMGPLINNELFSAKAMAQAERKTCVACNNRIIELGKKTPICQVTCTNLCALGTGDRAILDLSSQTTLTNPTYLQCKRNSPAGAQCVCSILMNLIAQTSNDAQAQQLGAQITSVCQCPSNVYDQATSNHGQPPPSS
jgi:hypothetical protein